MISFIAGVLIVLLFFVGVFIMCVVVSGWRMATIAFAATAAVVAMIAVGAYLLANGCEQIWG